MSISSMELVGGNPQQICTEFDEEVKICNMYCCGLPVLATVDIKTHGIGKFTAANPPFGVDLFCGFSCTLRLNFFSVNMTCVYLPLM